AVGAGFPRPDWSNRRNRRANQAQRAMQENDTRTEEWCGEQRISGEQRFRSPDMPKAALGT
ncbi:MAG: hypothetical protein AAB110_07865, partial [Candidatus Desantisbacteria bacterium]